MGLSQELSSGLIRKRPLVVDLEDALIRSNLFLESVFAHIGQHPALFYKAAKALTAGNKAFKSYIASSTQLDFSLLPYDHEVIGLIRQAVSQGIPVYLVSKNDERYVRDVAAHIGLFSGWFVSNESFRSTAGDRTTCLTEAFGKDGFDYVGASGALDPTWTEIRTANSSPAASSSLARPETGVNAIATSSGGAVAWLKLLRVHQWAKNALVFVPLITAQRFDLSAVGAATLAFFVFSLAASGIYIINDLVDIDADRKHPTKKTRPLAAGTVPTGQAIIAAAILIAVAVILASFVTKPLVIALGFYLLLTTAYTFLLKRKLLIDVILLATLYTVRVVAGATAIEVPLSEWLLAFSMAIFTTLALIKRYIELAARLDLDLPDPSNRDYRKSDLSILAALSGGTAFNAVTIFALYISSETVHRLYRHPNALWLICPILMYWLGRILMMAHRRELDDDPILFALTDRSSLFAFGLIGAILISAM